MLCIWGKDVLSVRPTGRGGGGVLWSLGAEGFSCNAAVVFPFHIHSLFAASPFQGTV